MKDLETGYYWAKHLEDKWRILYYNSDEERWYHGLALVQPPHTISERIINPITQ